MKKEAKEKKEREKEKSKPDKGKGEAYPPQPPAYKGKVKTAQPPTKERNGASYAGRQGTDRTQACWYSNQQHPQQHQQQQAWYQPSEQQPWPVEALRKRHQPQVYNIDQHTAYTGLTPDNQTMLSFEHQSQAPTQPTSTTPAYTIAQLDSFENASSTAETWGILVDTGAATSVAPKSFASDIELSPAPSTLQLTTATGNQKYASDPRPPQTRQKYEQTSGQNMTPNALEQGKFGSLGAIFLFIFLPCMWGLGLQKESPGKAVETYGLKKVHLQSQGLSLEVNFVIADVVTPLLGLDSMIKANLSLHIEHDLQHFLVNPAKDRTQLEHMGRHLYLIACPSQHGLSQCFIGSLSHVIGILPEDKGTS